MRVVNLTPHDVTILPKSGRVVNIPRSGVTARLSLTKTKSHTIVINGEDINVVRNEIKGLVTGLPSPAKDTIFIVSRDVAEFVGGRDDLYYPDSGIRDDEGIVVACKNLCQIW